MSNPFKIASDASKLSINQLQQALQNGTVPPYIGIPLLQDMVQKSKQSQAMSNGQQNPPTVAQQVMAQAQQVEQGVPALQSNLPVSMAGGGIVAFAEGGMYDEEEDSYEDRIDAERQADINALMDEYAQTFQGGIGQLPVTEEAKFVPREPSSGAKEGIAGSEDAANFIARIMHKESRGQRYGKDGQLLTSAKGARGEMQVMPGTSRDPGYGVKPARDDSPDEIARVGRDYAETLLARYGDPKIAAIAYNWGPGNTDKWLMAGADPSKLPKETQGYVKGFVKGGDVEEESESQMMKAVKAPFRAIGSGISSLYSNKAGAPSDKDYTASGDLAGAIMAESAPSVAKPVESKEKPKAETKPEVKPIAKGPTAYDLTSEEADRSYMPLARAAKEETAAVKPLSKLEQYQEALAASIGNREQAITKQREQDKYMALLSAGLGMMGGTSPNALANIGAGGQQGIQSLMASNKDRTAEENALLSGRLGLLKLGTSAEQAAEMRKLRADMQKDVLAQRAAAQSETSAARGERLSLAQQKELQDSLENRYAILSKNALKAAESIYDPVKKQEFLDGLDKKISQDKIYRSLHKARWGYMPGDDVGAAPAGAPSAIQSLLDKYK